MKYLFLCLHLAMLPAAMNAQTMGSGYTIGVAAIDMGKDLTEAQVMKLESKMLQVIEKSGVATAGYSRGIVLKPAISVEDTRTAEGGIQNITVTTCELTLYMANAGDNMVVYNTVSRKLRGSGSNAELALSNAINTMDVNDPLYKQFLTTSRQKIASYYNANCDKIMKLAAEAEKRRDYEAAVSLLQSVPMEVTCYATTNKKALDIYKKYEQQLCNRIVTYAKGEMAIGNYEAALDVLAAIEGRPGCTETVNQLIAEADKKVQRHIDRQYNLEAQRARALETIAMGYYMRAAKKKK